MIFPRVLTIRHLPKREILRPLHKFSLMFRLLILLVTFFLSFSCSLYEVKIPSAHTGSFVQFSPNGLLTLCLHDPTKLLWIFLNCMSLSPDMFSNSRSISIALVIESTFFRNKDVSSANWLILSSVLKIVMPSMFPSRLTLAARISAPNINK